MIRNEEAVNDILGILSLDRNNVSLYVKMDLDRYIQDMIDEEGADAYCVGWDDCHEAYPVRLL